ncbi:MAG TPA: hypothetical protein VFH42_04130 [Sporolactobacillaceae bacterium]|nr:hypothetical protein [Sporolactobacillaceae bacterium]
MRAGDVIFERGSGFLADTIRYFDDGPYSHVAIAVSDTEILEAQFGVRSRIVPLYFYDYEIIDCGFTDAQRERIKENANRLVGKKYDYLQIAWYVLRKWLGLKGHNFLNNPAMLICSECVFDDLELSHVLGHTLYINSDVTPNELFNYLSKRFNPKVIANTK